MKFCIVSKSLKIRSGMNAPVGRTTPLLSVGALVVLMPLFTQQPVIVQPGAPGKPTQTLPSSTRPELPPASSEDVKFMQGMIMHHAQAVEMTALIESHTENKNLRTLGARISRSQSDEIKFMTISPRGGSCWRGDEYTRVV